MVGRCSHGVLGQPDQFGVRTACSEDLGIVQSDYASPLPLKRASHHGCAAGLSAATHDLVDELDKIVIQSHSDLLAHTKMVPLWDQKAFLLLGRHMGCVSYRPASRGDEGLIQSEQTERGSIVRRPRSGACGGIWGGLLDQHRPNEEVA